MADQTPEPVGPEFGLTPRKSRDLVKPPFTSRDLVATDHYSTGTEFGGVAGLIQPPPHVPTARERRMMVMAIDPDDPGNDPSRGSVQPPDLEGDFT